ACLHPSGRRPILSPGANPPPPFTGETDSHPSCLCVCVCVCMCTTVCVCVCVYMFVVRHCALASRRALCISLQHFLPDFLTFSPPSGERKSERGRGGDSLDGISRPSSPFTFLRRFSV